MPNCQLGDVPFQKGGHVLIPPEQAVLVGCRQEGSGQSATPPEGLEALRVNIAQTKTTQRAVGDSSGQGFRTLADQIPGGASQNNKLAARLLIDKVAQDGEEIGHTLDLVDNDQPRQPFQGELGLFQAGKVSGIFQVEIGVGAKSLGKGRFSALPWAQNRRDGKQGDQLPQLGLIRFSVDQFHDGSLHGLH